MKQNCINHIALVLDTSASMSGIIRKAMEVANEQIASLADLSKKLDQETRVTVYTFDEKVECKVYDKDVLRAPKIEVPSYLGGSTKLLDATGKAIEDLEKTAQLYGDHAFLIYVLTDGEENSSRNVGAGDLERKLKGLPENWTTAVFVPNTRGKFLAEKYGFPAANIAVWETTEKGMKEVGVTVQQATRSYMTNRSTGMRGTKNLFSVDKAVANITSVDLAQLPKLGFHQYRLAEVKESGRIDEFVEKFTKRAYRLGEAYYQLSKTEKIQGAKMVAIQHKKTHAIYTGPDARKLIGLPDYEVKVAPTFHPDFDIFVQSTSVNRKLVAGTKLLLLS